MLPERPKPIGSVDEPSPNTSGMQSGHSGDRPRQLRSSCHCHCLVEVTCGTFAVCSFSLSLATGSFNALIPILRLGPFVCQRTRSRAHRQFHEKDCAASHYREPAEGLANASVNEQTIPNCLSLSFRRHCRNSELAKLREGERESRLHVNLLDSMRR